MMNVDIMKRYEISEKTGFLLDVDPHKLELPHKYRHWLDIAENLPYLLKDKLLRDKVDQLAVIDTSDLLDYSKLRHAHLVLGLITNCYVWMFGEDHMPTCIPQQLAMPLIDVSRRAGLPPIICHADLVLTNFVLIDESKPHRADNLRLMYEIVEDTSCDWFFLVTVEVEAECIPAIKVIVEGLLAVEDGLLNEVEECLNQLCRIIERIRLAFMRMNEKLSAEKFYNMLRPFLNGWHDCGMIYEGVSDEPIKAYGGSAAQCSGIQAIDLFLGVTHTTDKTQFLKAMRDYMPAKHKQFLEMLENKSKTRDFVHQHGQTTPGLAQSYNSCIDAMVQLRSTHIQIVVKYITIQAHRFTKNNFDTLKKQGTGGQQLLPFLKDIRCTTTAAKSG